MKCRIDKGIVIPVLQKVNLFLQHSAKSNKLKDPNIDYDEQIYLAKLNLLINNTSTHKDFLNIGKQNEFSY